MIKIEVLFPEVCNYFGDLFNIKYLEKNIKDVKIIYTSLTDVPHFVKNDVDMIYMAPTTEKMQHIVIDKLKPYVEKIKELIDKNKVFLLTGNAFEIFGDYIINEDKSKKEGLKITHLHAKVDMMHRYNSLFLGGFNDIKIVGFKSSFSMSYGDNSDHYLFDAIKGDGINKKTKLEGVRINNFFGTYLLGPILILNPLFTKYLLSLLGVNKETLEYDEEIMKCYQDRLKEFERNNIKF